MKRFLKQCKKESILFLLTNMVGASTDILFAFLLQYITDSALEGKWDQIGKIILFAGAHLLFATLFEFLSMYSRRKLQTKLSRLLRNAIVGRIQNCSVEEKEKLGNAHYLSILNNGVNTVETDYVYSILVVIWELFALLFALIATTTIQPMMALIVLVLSILPLFVPRLLQKKLEKLSREEQAAKAKYLDFLNEFMEGFQTVKIFGRGAEFRRHHEKINAETTDTILQNWKWTRFSMSLSYCMGLLVVIGAWVCGAFFTMNGSITVSQLVALTSLMNSVAGPFQIISDYYAGIISGRAVANDIMQFVDSEPTGAEYKSDEKDVRTLALEDVTVVRQGSPILSHAQVELARGKKVAILGGSGSGKSTLLRTISGILSAQEGEILLNGAALPKTKGLTHPDLLYIAQNTSIFSGTVGENIALYRDLPDENVENAIRRAGLGEWFARLGGNLQAGFDKSSINLSGGELKRVDFARVLLENAQIILFDEPTAGLDKFHAKSIMEQICAMEGKILAVATHDLDEENISRFDDVYIVESGKIVAHGCPQDIMRTAAFTALQQGEKDE